MNGGLNNNKSVRFQNGTAVGPETVHIEPGPSGPGQQRWSNVRNAFDFTSRVRHLRERDQMGSSIESGPSGPTSRRGSIRRSSLFSLGRSDPEEEESERARLALSSALSRTSFYHLPGSTYTETEADMRNRTHRLHHYRQSSEHNRRTSPGHPRRDASPASHHPRGDPLHRTNSQEFSSEGGAAARALKRRREFLI